MCARLKILQLNAPLRTRGNRNVSASQNFSNLHWSTTNWKLKFFTYILLGHRSLTGLFKVDDAGLRPKYALTFGTAMAEILFSIRTDNIRLQINFSSTPDKTAGNVCLCRIPMPPLLHYDTGCGYQPLYVNLQNTHFRPAHIDSYRLCFKHLYSSPVYVHKVYAQVSSPPLHFELVQ